MFSPANVFNLVTDDRFAMKIWDWFLLALNKRLMQGFMDIYSVSHLSGEGKAKLMEQSF